jgi:uncharacterized protein YsxB (DUF464 family)
MTTVIIKKTVDGIYKGFTCMGHSGFERRGKDIVCASISVLVINTINSMEELAGEDMDITTNEETGFINCPFKNPLSDKGELLMDSMILGLSQIAEQCGDKYLILKFEEV